MRNRNSKKEKKEKEGFYSFYKAEKLRSGKSISGIRPNCQRTLELILCRFTEYRSSFESLTGLST